MKLSEQTLLHSYADLGAAFSVEVKPDALIGAKLLCHSPDALDDLGVERVDLEDLRRLCAGEQLPAGARAIACVYAGHQFGVYVPQLGDGRALLLGELQTAHGLRDIQLKGAGQTPFSRGADGRAVLRSSVREFFCSEAMQALGISSTRAVALVATDELQVYREVAERAAICMRSSECLLRFGQFEFFCWSQQSESLQMLVDYCIERCYPACADAENPALELLRCTVERTARLIAQWQAVGFVHGVMNSDNMSILGETVDYGPYAFLDNYDIDAVYNHSDHEGRYAYGRQPQIGLWNCGALGTALGSLINDDEAARAVLETYQGVYVACYLELMRQRLGLLQPQQGDWELVKGLLQNMQTQRLDYNWTLRKLAVWVAEGGCSGGIGKASPPAELAQLSSDWLALYQQRIETQDYRQQGEVMLANNPVFVLRTWVAQEAIERAEAGDTQWLSKLLGVLRAPYEECADMDMYSRPPPDDYHCELSCSS